MTWLFFVQSATDTEHCAAAGAGGRGGGEPAEGLLQHGEHERVPRGGGAVARGEYPLKPRPVLRSCSRASLAGAGFSHFICSSPKLRPVLRSRSRMSGNYLRPRAEIIFLIKIYCSQFG